MGRISEAVIRRELEEIVGVVAEQPAGLSARAIGRAYAVTHGRTIPGRTLQRRLERLVVERRLTTKGEGKSTIYLPSPSAPTPEEAQPAALSAGALRLHAAVRRPVAEREPAGYERDWLFGYEPGKSWYLTKPQRAHLRAVGTTPDDDRPAGTFAKDILSRLLIDLAWASSRLEGNTYTRLDTRNLLEFGQRAAGKDAAEAQMILNHKAAIEFVVEAAAEDAVRRTTILSIHALLAENLLDDSRDEGRLRERPVSITGTSYMPTAIPQVINESFERVVQTLNAIPDPFEQAFFAMVHISYLQPFVDVNKRTSRLVANLPLIRANMCPLSFVDVSEREYVLGTLAIYEQRGTELLRDVFISAYERSAAQYRIVRHSVVQPDPIRLRYRNQLRDAVQGIVREGLAPSVEVVRGHALRTGIPEPDQARFAEVALELLLNLNEGSAARYGLRPSEFGAWKRLVRVS